MALSLQDAFAAGTPDGLMTPFIARSETIAEPGPVVCGMIADVGWTLAGRCAELVGPLPQTVSQVTATRRGPNPFFGTTTIEIESLEPVSVRVTLIDMLGRRVRDYGTMVLVGGTARDIQIGAPDLAPGVYVLSVRGGPEALAVPVTVVR